MSIDLLVGSSFSLLVVPLEQIHAKKVFYPLRTHNFWLANGSTVLLWGKKPQWLHAFHNSIDNMWILNLIFCWFRGQLHSYWLDFMCMVASGLMLIVHDEITTRIIYVCTSLFANTIRSTPIGDCMHFVMHFDLVFFFPTSFVVLWVLHFCSAVILLFLIGSSVHEIYAHTHSNIVFYLGIFFVFFCVYCCCCCYYLCFWRTMWLKYTKLVVKYHLDAWNCFFYCFFLKTNQTFANRHAVQLRLPNQSSIDEKT